MYTCTGTGIAILVHRYRYGHIPTTWHIRCVALLQYANMPILRFLNIEPIDDIILLCMHCNIAIYERYFAIYCIPVHALIILQYICCPQVLLLLATNGQRPQVAATATWGSLQNLPQEKPKEDDMFTFIPGKPEKTARKTSGAIRMLVDLGRQLRLYMLVNSRAKLY